MNSKTCQHDLTERAMAVSADAMCPLCILGWLEEARKALEAAGILNQQLHDRLTCMCGSDVSHSAFEGHTPVSMYDYALDTERERANQAEAALRRIERLRENKR